MPIISKFPYGGVSKGLPVGNVSNITTISSYERIYIKWTDPDDLVMDGAHIAEWDGTILVRKAGSYPSDHTDGIVVIDNKERNKYSAVYFEDDGLSNGITYYYKLFPYTIKGMYTNSTENQFMQTPEKIFISSISNLSTAKGGYKKIGLSWTDPNQSLVEDGVEVAKWASTNVAIKSGSYADNIDDPDIISITNVTTHNNYRYNDLIIDVPNDNSNYYVSIFCTTTDGVVGHNSENNNIISTPGRIQIKIPSLLRNLVYNGNPQSPTWINYDPSKMEMSGPTVVTNAEYNIPVEFTPFNDYVWPGDTYPEPILRTFDVEQATGDMSANAGNILFNPSMTSINITLSGDFDGTLTATVSNSSLATTSINGNVVTVTSSGKNGSGTIYISASGQNYTRASVDVLFSSEFVNIYGAQWDGTSTTAWARTDASADFVDPIPAIGFNIGSSPFDNLMPWKGVTRGGLNPDGSVFIKIPKFWFKWTVNGNSLKLQIADGPVEGFSVSPAHMDRGDGHGERDLVEVGAYHCDSNYLSRPGSLPITNITRATARSNIISKNSSIPGTYQWDFAMRQTIQMLYLVEFADWDSQKKIGYGCSSNGVKAITGQTGSIPYHTGTTAYNDYGFTKYREIEGLWDNVYDWLDGCYYDNNGLNIILNPNSFNDISGGVNIGSISGSGVPMSIKLGSGDYDWAFMPNAMGGSMTTYITDEWFFAGSVPCLRSGGNYNKNRSTGLFRIGATSITSNYSYIGCRLMIL